MRISLCFSLAAISVAAVLRYYYLSEPRPEIELHPQLIDLGELNELQRVAARLTIHNRSQAHYRVVGLQSSCYCTAAALAVPKDVPPGLSVPVSFGYDARRGDGPREHRLIVLLERQDAAGSRPVAMPIKLRCTIRPELRSTPPTLDLGTVGADDGGREFRFTVISVSGAAYDVTSVETTSRHIAVSGPRRIGRDGAQIRGNSSPWRHCL